MTGELQAMPPSVLTIGHSDRRLGWFGAHAACQESGESEPAPGASFLHGLPPLNHAFFDGGIKEGDNRRGGKR
jgi:hypothetical protein